MRDVWEGSEIKILRANKLFISSCRRLLATFHCHLASPNPFSSREKHKTIMNIEHCHILMLLKPFLLFILSSYFHSPWDDYKNLFHSNWRISFWGIYWKVFSPLKMCMPLHDYNVFRIKEIYKSSSECVAVMKGERKHFAILDKHK